MTTGSERQRDHYERIHDAYERHYYDPTSMDYRRRFVFDVLFRGLDLDGKLVADLASGSGHNSLAVLQRFPRARVMGFDISRSACASYRRLVGAEAHELDLTKGPAPAIGADAALVVGGLHHCVTDLDGTFRTIAGMLRPGGLLLMYEPSSEFLLEAVRTLWYRHDRYFDAATERALAHHELAEQGRRAGFVPVDCVHAGGPAYFLILNSLLFRIPVGAKRYLAPPLVAVERLYNRLPGRRWFPTFLARWRKADA